MQKTLYSKSEMELPFLISKKYSKNIQEGTIKDKWELKWVVLTEEVNTFIQDLDTSFNDLALSDVSRDERGPLTILTANYGDTGLSEDYDENGEISWWSYSGSQLTFHIKRWVVNTPDAIKDFIYQCLNNYGYKENEVQVNCNPVAGEPRVMCEASFTHNNELGDLGDDSSNDNFNEEEADEKGIVEETDGVQMSSNLNTIEIPTDLYLSKAMKMSQFEVAKLLEIIQEEDAGRIRFLDIMEYGTKIKQSGWYSNDDDNPQAILKPKYPEGGNQTRQNVKNCRRKMKNIPQGTYLQISVTVNKTIKKKDKITMSDIVDKLEDAGEESDTIHFEGGAIQIPKDALIAKAGGYEFEMKTVWLNQGFNFDGDSIKYKSKLTPNHNPYWEGKGVQNYVSKSELIYEEITLD